jgi:hypothetical protein
MGLVLAVVTVRQVFEQSRTAWYLLATAQEDDLGVDNESFRVVSLECPITFQRLEVRYRLLHISCGPDSLPGRCCCDTPWQDPVVVVGGDPDKSFSRASTLGGAGTHAILGVQAGEDIGTQPDLIRSKLLLAWPRGMSILLWEGLGEEVKRAYADNAIGAFGPAGTFRIACGLVLEWAWS